MFHRNILSLFIKAKFAPNLIILTDFEKFPRNMSEMKLNDKLHSKLTFGFKFGKFWSIFWYPKINKFYPYSNIYNSKYFELQLKIIVKIGSVSPTQPL